MGLVRTPPPCLSPRIHGRSQTTLSALSLSLLLLLHRLLTRFFTTLRRNLLHPTARPFRKRHPRTTTLLTSPLSPPLFSSLSGAALALHPPGPRRLGISIYLLIKSLEWWYDTLERTGVVPGRDDRPWWWAGSWALFPVASAELLQAFVFRREGFPGGLGKFIMQFSGEYLPGRPGRETYPVDRAWPGVDDIVDGVKQVARLGYP